MLVFFYTRGSHALVGKMRGLRLLEFAPYPHVKNGKSYHGRVLLDYKNEWGTKERSRDQMWTSSAPMLLNTALIGGFTALKLSDKLPENVWGRLGLTMLATIQSVDLLNHAKLGARDGDSFKLVYSISHLTGSNRNKVGAAVRGTQFAVAGLGLIMSGHEFYKILKEGSFGLPSLKIDDSRPQKKSGNDFYLTPSLVGSGQGITFGGTF